VNRRPSAPTGYAARCSASSEVTKSGSGTMRTLEDGGAITTSPVGSVASCWRPRASAAGDRVRRLKPRALIALPIRRELHRVETANLAQSVGRSAAYVLTAALSAVFLASVLAFLGYVLDLLVEMRRTLVLSCSRGWRTHPGLLLLSAGLPQRPHEPAEDREGSLPAKCAQGQGQARSHCFDNLSTQSSRHEKPPTISRLTSYHS